MYDPSAAGGYPNGRRLTDDVVDPLVAMVTMGRVTADGVGPQTDLLDLFPSRRAPRCVGLTAPEHDSPRPGAPGYH